MPKDNETETKKTTMARAWYDARIAINTALENVEYIGKLIKELNENPLVQLFRVPLNDTNYIRGLSSQFVSVQASLDTYMESYKSLIEDPNIKAEEKKDG